MMDRKLRDDWCAALRSGEYKQGTGKLRSKDDAFCCLGVLCDVVDPTKWKRTAFNYGWGSLTILPGPDLIDDEPVNALWQLNDSKRATFPEIADWIESNIPVRDA